MKTVKDIMTWKPVCCIPDTSLETVAKMMLEHDCGEIPVVESASAPKVIGVITDRDIVGRAVAAGKNPLELKAGDYMTSPCFTVGPKTAIGDCCSVLEEHRIRRVPVVDEQGYIVGIVSQADIVLKTTPQRAAEVLQQVSAHA